MIASLGDLVEIKGGGTPSRKTSEYWGGNIPWATVKDFKGLELSSTLEKITQEGLKHSASNLIPAGSIIVPTRMAVGKAAINLVDMSINQDLKALKIRNSKKVDRDYLFRALLSKADFLKRRGKGATVKGITLDVLNELEIPLPPLEEQKRIAAILDKADALRRKRQQAINLTDQHLRSVFLDMFGDPVTNPKGWQKVKLGELCSICRGGSPRPIQKYLGGTLPWIKIGDATKNNDIYIDSTKEKIHESGLSKTRLLQPGALIFANCGVSLGFARIINFAGCIHDGWLAFEVNDPRLNQLFLLKALNQITVHFRLIAPDGTQPNLNTSIMQNFELIFPPIELQEKFEKIVHKVNSMKTHHKNAFDSSNSAFNSITQQAFRGDLTKQSEAA